MSAANSRAGYAGRTIELSPAAVAEADLHACSILEGYVDGAPQDEALAQIVACLRSTEYCISDLLEDIGAVKARVGIDGGRALEELLALAVSRTALVHETAIETMLHGFCELDRHGRIIYANPALSDLLPDCEGSKLERWFLDGERIRTALEAADWTKSHRHQLSTARGVRPVLVHFGPITRGEASAFAFVIDLTDEEEVERVTLDAAEFGVVKLDPELHITYANSAACHFFGSSLDQVLGHTPWDFIKHPADKERLNQHAALRTEGVSTEYDLEITPRDGGTSTHVRVRSIPQLDPDGQLVSVTTTLSPIDTEIVAERIKAAIAWCWRADELFEAVLQEIRCVLPFTAASLSTSTKDARFSRRLRSFPKRETDQRWVAMPSSVRHLFEQEFTCGRDLNSFFGDAPDRGELKKNKAVQALLASGLQSWISLRVRGPDSDARLTLMHTDPGTYDHKPYEIAEKLGLRHAMCTVLQLDYYDERIFHAELAKDMARQRTDRDLARLVVTRLADYYRWQNVSIFKINAQDEQFELLEQAAGPGGYRLPDDHTQALDTGVLGMALDQNKLIVVGDALQEETATIFRSSGVDTRSELCVPIRLGETAAWLFNIEDRSPYAFNEVDAKKVHEVLEELEPCLARTLGAALLEQALADTPDGIVIADFEGMILMANRTAADMLGEEADQLSGQALWRYFESGTEGYELARRGRRERTVPIEATLISAHGKRTAVLVRTKIPTDSYERRIVVLQDRDKVDWQAETRRLARITSEARVPLSLVSTFLREIRRTAGEAEGYTAQLADHAIKQLGRIELTYDRLGERPELRPRRHKIDISALIQETIDSLPSPQRALIDLEFPGKGLEVRANRQQLSSSILSMIAYLLRTGDLEGPISIRAKPVDRGVELRLFKARTSPDGLGTFAERRKAVDETLARSALDEPRLYQFAGISGGKFSRRRGSHGETMRLLLPSRRSADV